MCPSFPDDHSAQQKRTSPLDILYLLIPLSAVLVLAIIGVFGWALHRGQFDDVEREGNRILESDVPPIDADQVQRPTVPKQSPLT